MSEVKDYGNGYNSNNSVAIVWAIEDVRYQLEYVNEYEGVNLELTDDQCMQVLQRIVDNHDAEWGVNWENIYSTILYCFEDEINDLKENANVN
tara:strand:- start:24 stop:302 length:279 start_codon:yes stop_codon:yes gene_type:complete